MRIELEAAEALLDIGVSVPFKEIKLPFRKKPVTIRMTMRRPYMGGLIRIERQMLKLGVTSEQIEAFSVEEQAAFMDVHGRRLARMIALTICRGWLSGLILAPLVAWAIRWKVPNKFILGAYGSYISLLGIRPFINIIRSTERTRILKPRLRLSQRKKGS